MRQGKKSRTKVGKSSLQGLRTIQPMPGNWWVQIKALIHEVRWKSGENGYATGGWEIQPQIGMGRVETGELVQA